MDADTGVDDFIRARWPSLVRSAVFLGATPTEAEDLAQTALMRCLRAWTTVSVAHDQDAYVFRVLVNCFHKSRTRRWWKEVPSSDGLPDRGSAVDVADRAVTKDFLLQALSRLTAEQRSVLVLRYYADLSERQVAAALQIPIGTVKSRTARGLERLLADLGGTRCRPSDARSQS